MYTMYVNMNTIIDRNHFIVISNFICSVMLNALLQRLSIFLYSKILHLEISVQCFEWVLAALDKCRYMMKYGIWRSDWVTVSTGTVTGTIHSMHCPLTSTVQTSADDGLRQNSVFSSEDIIRKMQATLQDITN